MKALWITLAVIGGLLFLFLCLLFFGKAKIRIRCAGKLRVVASVCGPAWRAATQRDGGVPECPLRRAPA